MKKIEAIKTFDSLKEALHGDCPICQKELVVSFSTGKHDDVTTRGNSEFAEIYSREGQDITITRSFTLEETVITNTLVLNLDTNSYTFAITPSLDELVEKFPIHESFMEFDEGKFSYSIEKGAINIWRIYAKLTLPKFLVQSCPEHYRRLSVIEMDFDEQTFSSVYNFDEFHYIPTPHDKEFYVIHRHMSSSSRNKAVVFIGKVTKNNMEAVDTNKGGVFLWEPKDNHLMNFDFSNLTKLGRKLQMLSAMR